MFSLAPPGRKRKNPSHAFSLSPCFGLDAEITYSYTTVLCTLASSQTQWLEALEKQETAPATDDGVLCDL